MGVLLGRRDHCEARHLDEGHEEGSLAWTLVQPMAKDRHRVRQRAGTEVAVEGGLEIGPRLAVDGPEAALAAEIEPPSPVGVPGLDPDAPGDVFGLALELVGQPIWMGSKAA